jgi:hypothetical protein
MSATLLLAELSRRGIKLEARGEQLRFFPKAAVGATLRGALRKHKGELLALLAGGPVPPGCRRCGSHETHDVLIHAGQSVRRDCARCGRFLEFPVWYGVAKTDSINDT